MTQPVNGLLSRDLPGKDVVAFVGRIADLLDECVAYGTHVFVTCDRSEKQGGYHDATLLLLYRHVLEMTDGVAVLIRSGAIDPCNPLLRSVMEASLGIHYILEKDTEQRALSYQVAHIHKRIGEHTRHDPKTNAGQDFQRILNEDNISSGIKLPPHASAPAIEKLAKVLAMPEYTKVDQEWERLYMQYAKKGRKGLPAWFSLFNGPKSIRQLAFHLKWGAFYEALYSTWSESVHASNAMLTVSGSEKAIRPLRRLDHAQLVTTLGVTFVCHTTRAMLGHYAPNSMDAYAKWYMTNVRDLYQDIASRQILKVK